MDIASAVLILRLIAQGVGVAEEIASLAKRVLAGEAVTAEDVEAATLAVEDAKSAWDAAGG